jgi:hypothetical protein
MTARRCRQARERTRPAGQRAERLLTPATRKTKGATAEETPTTTSQSGQSAEPARAGQRSKNK